MNEPAGGWHWKCTAAPATPETIYGFALVDAASSVIYASQLIPVPIVIAAVADEIDIGAAQIVFVLQPWN